MFMDALCSSAPKGNPKKRKRLAGNSKDGSPPPTTPDSPTAAAAVVAPLKFYQDTLTEDKESAAKEEQTTPASPTDPASPTASDAGSSPKPATTEGETDNNKDEEEEMEVDDTPKPPGPGCGPNGPPGVLVLHRRRGPKKVLRWRAQEQLEEVRLFELDETERVNVTKTFTDMKQQDAFGERDAFNVGRKLHGTDDVMVEQTPWTQRFEVEDVPQTACGGQSKEREVQAAREGSCLQALYFSFATIPDSPAEPDTETYKYAEPAVMPLEDAQNTVNDFTKQGWPQPKVGDPNNGHGLPQFLNNGAFVDPFLNNMAFAGNGGAGGLPFNGPPPGNGVWANGGGVPPFVGGGGGPFGNGLNPEEIKVAMNRLAFPGQTFNAPNFNGINMMNLPAMGAGGPMMGGWGGPGFRGPPPMGGGGNGGWRGQGPQQQNHREWSNNNNNHKRDGRACKNYINGNCKRGDRCNFVH